MKFASQIFRNLLAAAQAARSFAGRMFTAVFMLAITAQMSYAQFLNNVQNAKAVNSATITANTTAGVNNWAIIVAAVSAVIGLVITAVGIYLVRKAHTDDRGGTPAKGGWITIGCGVALGALVPIFMWGVGLFNGITN